MFKEAVTRRDKISFEEGMEKGVEKGREDSKKETARRLKKAGMDIVFIEQMTDLSAEEIERL